MANNITSESTKLESIPIEPKNVRVHDFKRSSWSEAMRDALKALAENSTWELVPRTPNTNVFGCKWVFKTKLHVNGSRED